MLGGNPALQETFFGDSRKSPYNIPHQRLTNLFGVVNRNKWGSVGRSDWESYIRDRDNRRAWKPTTGNAWGCCRQSRRVYWLHIIEPGADGWIDTHKDKPPGTITLTVTSPDNEKLAIRVRPDQKIQSIERAIENRWGSDNWREWRLTYASKTDYYWASFSTIEGLGIEDGDNLYLVRNQIGGKPVIYLFSPKTLEAEVKLSLISQWKLCAIYPVVPSKPRTVLSNDQVAWKVRTHANGDLTELTTGLNVTYLFWEA